jgi:aspartyl protease family protein
MPSSTNDNSGRTAGKGMLIFSFSIGLALLTIFFDDLLQERVNPNQNPASIELISGVREVKLKRNRQGHYIANGEINSIPVTFLVDTGATDVAIPESIANQAGLPKGEARQAATANGIVNVYSTKVASLTLGNISLYDIDASITPSMFNDTILLGMSALSEIDFSQVGASLTLKQTPN